MKVWALTSRGRDGRLFPHPEGGQGPRVAEAGHLVRRDRYGGRDVDRRRVVEVYPVATVVLVIKILMDIFSKNENF